MENNQKGGLGASGQSHSPTTAEADPAESLPFAKSPDNDFVSIFQKFSLLSGRQGERILAARGQLQQASARGLIGA